MLLQNNIVKRLWFHFSHCLYVVFIFGGTIIYLAKILF